MVSIPGGEPLLHPQMPEIVAGLVARKKYVYMCTNALAAEREAAPLQAEQISLLLRPRGRPARAPRFLCLPRRWIRHRDGRHQGSASQRGFRVTTNTTLFDGADPNSVRAHFDELMEARRREHDGLAGLLLRQGPRPEALSRTRAHSQKLFRAILSNRKKSWRFNQSPLFMEFLMGKQQYACTPWGMPTFNIFGWQKPCYLLQDGYADTFKELMETTAVARVRHRERQSQVRELHGALRIRSLGGRPHLQLHRRDSSPPQKQPSSAPTKTSKRSSC